MKTTQTLDKKYRPRNFEEFFGNDALVKSLQSVLIREEGIPGSILLQGPSGCGKTTLARIIISLLEALDRDAKQYNISNTTGVDAARGIIKYVGVAPWGKYKIVVLNECHRASKNFWDAMLETLEEPPPGVHFILCTTDPNRLLKTVRTRCTTYTVQLLPRAEMLSLLGWVTDSEQVGIDGNVANAVTKAAEGSPRRALVLLDSIIDLPTPEEQLSAVESFTFADATTLELCQAIATGAKWQTTGKLIKALEDDPETTRRAILGYLSNILIKGGKAAPAIALRMDHFSKNLYDTGRAGLIQACYFALH